MKRIDKLIEAVEKGADPGFLVDRETAKQEELPPFERVGLCTAALEQAGYRYVETLTRRSPVGSAQIWNKETRWIRLWEDGSWDAGEGSRVPAMSEDFFTTGGSCHDLLRDGWPDIVFY